MSIPRATLVAKTVATVRTSGDLQRDETTKSITHLTELDAGDFVAYAARVSNPSNQLSEWSYAKLLAYLKRSKHWSPFEMSNAVIECVTTRDISHQVIRHHSFRFQEFSQRYAEATGFHIHEARRQDVKNRQNSIDDLDDMTKLWWRERQAYVIDTTSTIYQQALERGIAKECARKVLPEGLTETTFYMNGYLRSWIHYLAQRLDPSTQKEHRDLALAIDAELRREIPQVFDLEE